MAKKINKVKEIIEKEFDSRVALMALTYTLGQLGMDNAAKITDEDISSMEGNPMMTKEFVQALARTAQRIGKECDFVNDVIPYILEEFDYLKQNGEEDEW